MVARVAARHPAEELAVVDDEVRERELVRVEDERRQAQGERRDPEVDEPVGPERRRDVEHAQCEPEAHVDGRPGEARVEDRERVARRREAAAGGDVARAAERQVGQDRLGVDLGREDFEHGRHRAEMLAEADQGLAGAALGELCER